MHGQHRQALHHQALSERRAGAMRTALQEMGIQGDLLALIPVVLTGAECDESHSVPDPVAEGFAVSLARPGGNVTGLANLFENLTPKQLQIFKETLPRATRIALLSDPEMGLGDLDTAIGAAKSESADGVHVLPSPFFDRNREHIASLAASARLPTISESALYVRDGGLMSYGPSFPAMWRYAANYVDRILKGAKPGDSPIEQPTTYELVVNLKTARAIGLSIPQTILPRADSVLE